MKTWTDQLWDEFQLGKKYAVEQLIKAYNIGKEYNFNEEWQAQFEYILKVMEKKNEI